MDPSITIKPLLSYPFGTYLKIEGTRVNEGKVGTRTLLVDTINGKKLTNPVFIWVDNTSDLPEAGRVILQGYETGGFAGIPSLPKEEAEKWGGSQIVFGFHHNFIPTTILAPGDLKFINPPHNQGKN
ncbi:hypothetical protein BH09VER1_BH09VER1_55320 [soil metagenome]